MTESLYKIGRTSEAPGKAALPIPSDFVELSELRGEPVDRRLGYFGNAPIVIFGYCPGGAEVIWRDGQSSGFGAGGWRLFLERIVPLARQHRVDIGDLAGAGTHVLLLDRSRGSLYAAPRRSAEIFLSLNYGITAPRRPCLCAVESRDACPGEINKYGLNPGSLRKQ